MLISWSVRTKIEPHPARQRHTAAGVTARRFVAMAWDASLPGAQAAEKAGVPIAWLSIARMPVEPG
jgi:hypothetical protein